MSHTTNSDVRSGGQRRRAELLTLPCAAQPRVAPKEVRAASEPWVKEPRSDEELPVFNEPFVTNALGLESVGHGFARVGVSRTTQDQRALDSAQDITLLRATVGGERVERGDRVGLVLSLSPAALPHMLTRSRSAATSGSREPFATMGSMVPRQ